MYASWKTAHLLLSAVLLQIGLSIYDAVCLIGAVRDFVANFSAFDTKICTIDIALALPGYMPWVPAPEVLKRIVDFSY